MNLAQSAILSAFSTTHLEASKYSMNSSRAEMLRTTIISLRLEGDVGPSPREGIRSKVTPTGEKE